MTTPWSMTFDEPVAPDVVALIREVLGEPAAHDCQAFLFDSITRASQVGFAAISSRAGHAPALALYHIADMVALSNGDLYRATFHGWQRVRRD